MPKAIKTENGKIYPEEFVNSASLPLFRFLLEFIANHEQSKLLIPITYLVEYLTEAYETKFSIVSEKYVNQDDLEILNQVEIYLKRLNLSHLLTKSNYQVGIIDKNLNFTPLS